jgi:YkoY family integral membrane protein
VFGQTFAVGDIPTIVTLAVLEGLLSADNALVLAILVRALPKHQQQKGLLYGLAGAFVFRGIFILLASVVIRFWWIQLGGALYLMYLAVWHFVKKAKGVQRQRSAERKGFGFLPLFWSVIVVVELTDLAFAIDSVLAAVALVGPPPHGEAVHPKLWIIYAGGFMGLVAMRFVAGFFIRLLERFARLEASAYLIIAWISVKLGVESYGYFMQSVYDVHVSSAHLPPALFWSVTLALFAMGFIPMRYSLRGFIRRALGRAHPAERPESSGAVED